MKPMGEASFLCPVCHCDVQGGLNPGYVSEALLELFKKQMPGLAAGLSN